MLKLVTRIGIKVQQHIYLYEGSEFEGEMSPPHDFRPLVPPICAWCSS